MPNNILLGNRKVGEAQPTFVIAEAGINHNGDVDTAKEMIAAAQKKSGLEQPTLQRIESV